MWKDGYCFLVQVVYLGEVGIARRVMTPQGVARMEDTTLSKRLNHIYDTVPKHHAAISGISSQDESFGIACRLANRWISSQLLAG